MIANLSPQKVLDFTGRIKDSHEARTCNEVHECFSHTMIEKATKKGHVMVHFVTVVS